MSLESVRKYFADYGMEERVVTLDQSTATVDEAARAHGVDPDQIAKTLSFKIDDNPILIVFSGRARLDNRKFKDEFRTKARMLNPEEVQRFTGHSIGGVCPFGLSQPVAVYLDESLRDHAEVIPAAGGKSSAIRLTIEELEKYSRYQKWIDVGRKN